MTRTGRNDPCPCGSGKKFKKCHGSPEARDQREREIYGTFGTSPHRATAERRPEKDIQETLERIKQEKAAGNRHLPSERLISIGEVPPENERRFLVDACAKLVDENWCGRSEMCIYFAALLRHGLVALGYEATVEVGKARYTGGRKNFEWDHAWVRSSGNVIDGNVDSIPENPFVPEGINPAPYWGPESKIPTDRSLERTRTLPPERDALELDRLSSEKWKRSLEEKIKNFARSAARG